MKVNRVSIGSISEIITKGTTPTTIGLNFTDVGIPFLRVNNIQNGKIMTDEILFINSVTNKVLSRSQIKPRDVLISIAGTIGRTMVVPVDAPAMNCNQAIAIIRLLDIADPYYVNYWLGTLDAVHQITGAKVSTTISNLSLGCIKNLKIPLPPLEEQKRIAAILDKADSIRRKRKEAIKLTEELLRSVFLDMFGDPVTNPKGWEVVQLGDFINIKGGGTPDRKNTKYWGGNIPWASVKDITSLELEDTQEFITEEGVKNSATNIIPPNNVLIVTRMAVGRVCLTKTSIAINQDIKALFCGDKLLPKYLLYFLLCFTNNLIQYENGSTVKGINIEILKKIRLNLPPLAQQNKFIMIENHIRLCINKNTKMFYESENLFNCLIQRAFRGEL